MKKMGFWVTALIMLFAAGCGAERTEQSAGAESQTQEAEAQAEVQLTGEITGEETTDDEISDDLSNAEENDSDLFAFEFPIANRVLFKFNIPKEYDIHQEETMPWSYGVSGITMLYTIIDYPNCEQGYTLRIYIPEKFPLDDDNEYEDAETVITPFGETIVRTKVENQSIGDYTHTYHYERACLDIEEQHVVFMVSYDNEDLECPLIMPEILPAIFEPRDDIEAEKIELEDRSIDVTEEWYSEDTSGANTILGDNGVGAYGFHLNSWKMRGTSGGTVLEDVIVATNITMQNREDTSEKVHISANNNAEVMHYMGVEQYGKYMYGEIEILEEKEQLETPFGIAKIFYVKSSQRSSDEIVEEEVALLKNNGIYVVFRWQNNTNDGEYHGRLKEILQELQ